MLNNRFSTSISKYKSNIDNLNPSLQNKINSRPTYTILNKQSSESDMYSKLLTVQRQYKTTFELPNEFNGPEVWKDYLNIPKNQGNCGGCWAFASVSVLADRFNIMTKNRPRINLSPLRPIVCGVQDFNPSLLYSNTSSEVIEEQQSASLLSASCYGNTLLDAFRYIYVFGTTTEECNPYNEGGVFYRPLGKFEEDKDLPLCSTISSFTRDMCDNYVIDVPYARLYGVPARFYRFGVIYSVPGTPEQNSTYKEIMFEIFHWGPVATGFIVYPDFYEFDPKTEIYEWNGKGKSVGGHAVEIVGWGEENGEKYWWIKNSWGPEWGINGYFKFSRGKNNCEIEENVYAGIPAFFNTLDYFFQERFKNTNIIEDDRYLRNILDLGGTGVLSGGIDPYTGYSRRALEYYPDLTSSYPINIKNIPDMTNFIAGNVKSKIELKVKPTPIPPPIKQQPLMDSNRNLFSLYLLSFICGLYSYFFKNTIVLITYLMFMIIINKDILAQFVFIFVGGLMGKLLHIRFKIRD
jgi:hypothetical protein